MTWYIKNNYSVSPWALGSLGVFGNALTGPPTVPDFSVLGMPWPAPTPFRTLAFWGMPWTALPIVPDVSVFEAPWEPHSFPQAHALYSGAQSNDSLGH